MSSWAPLLRISPQPCSVRSLLWPRSHADRAGGGTKQGTRPSTPVPYEISPGSLWKGPGEARQGLLHPAPGRLQPLETACPDLYPPPRPGAASWPPTCCLDISCSVRPGLLNMGVLTKLDSGKISLCPFNKNSQRVSSVPIPGLPEGSLPRCGPARSEGSCPCWSLHLKGTFVHLLLALCFASSFSYISLLAGSTTPDQGAPCGPRHCPGCSVDRDP